MGNAFLDLTNEVYFDTGFGMLGIAFHPKFAENGRFFASFSCDKAEWPDCASRCACNSDIFFGPGDGFLYIMMGDGGGVNDPYNVAQNKKSLLGKIMRFDIDNIPSAGELSRHGLWGNYYIPKDNPHNTVDNELQGCSVAAAANNDNGYGNYLINEEEGINVQNVVTKCTEI
ncbi:hypothetical protein ACS0TY_013084 [Phlomoides rotata]